MARTNAERDAIIDKLSEMVVALRYELNEAKGDVRQSRRQARAIMRQMKADQAAQLPAAQNASTTMTMAPRVVRVRTPSGRMANRVERPRG